MNYQIDPTSGVPAYLQLYTLLKQDITAGVYPWGSRLPSKRTIAQDTGVSVITVEHAAALLCEEGYAEARERSGCYVIFRPGDFSSGEEAPAAARQAVLPREGSSGDFPFSVMARTMRRVLQDYGDRILVRSPNAGCSELREELCAWLARSRGIRVSPEQIVVGSGAEYLYGLIAQLLGGSAPFALEDPGYEKIRRGYEACGVRCRLLPMGPDGIDSAALRSTDAGVLHVTPFHSFPSGITVSVSRKLAYLDWGRERGGILIEDNYDSELTVSRKPEEPLFAMAGGKGVIYLNTFSKTIAPAMRIGYMVLPGDLAEEFRERLGFYACTVPVFDQLVLTELLRSGDFERHINRVRRKKRREENP